MSKIPKDTVKKISPEFQKRLCEFVSDYGGSNVVFAAKVGVSNQVIERATIYGIIPSLKSLIKIADFLNVSLSYLLAETDNEKFYKSDYPTSFHVRLEQLRNEKETKYSKIAHSMPFAENLFYEWLRRNTLPSLEYLNAIAEYFSVSVDYLLGRTDERN